MAQFIVKIWSNLDAQELLHIKFKILNIKF
jgi:hypothetical protein